MKSTDNASTTRTATRRQVDAEGEFRAYTPASTLTSDAESPPWGRRAMVVCDQWLGSTGFTGLNALRRKGWDVHVIPEWEFVPVHWSSRTLRMVGRILRPFAERELARELVSDAQHLAPEFLLVFKGRFIRPGTIRTLRRLGVRCYNFFPDVSFRVHGPHLSRTLREYDWIFTTKTFGLKDMRDQLGISNASLLMHAFDPDVHHPVSLSERDHQLFDCDVSFIGTWSPKKEALLGELLSRRPNLRMRIWGDQWWSVTTRAHTLRSAIAGRAATGVEYAKAICGSLINIAILSEKRAGASCGDQITSRTFHLPACGGFVLHERTDEVRALFREDDEIVCFTGVDELIAKVDEFLPDERRRRLIAERGRAVVQEHHSWDERIRVILAHHERTRV